MRYTRARDYLSRHARDMRARDMRRRGGRDYDYNYDKTGDMAYNREYYPSGGDRNDYRYDYAMGGRSSQYGGEYYKGNGSYDMTYYPVRRSGYFDYNTYGGDYASGADYKLTPTEIRKWDRELKNRGSPFEVEQVKQIAQKLGLHFDEYSPELLTVIANMEYDDHKKSAKGNLDEMVLRAHEFLCDDDFDGTPDEKAYFYYTVFVNKDDD